MWWYRLLLCCALLAAWPAQAQGQDTQAPARFYRIGPGPLGAALSRLADEAGVLFVADARLTQGKATPGIEGAYGLQAAFARLLEGSGLELVQDGAQFGLRPSRVADAGAGSAQRGLPPVLVRAHALHPGYAAQRAWAASRTDTPLRELPQSVTVLTRELIDDQAPQSVSDLLRWVPGMGAAQGEGNRDTPVFRGNSATADFLFDGMRDDVQYYRDLYNVERVEVLKGPNAMLMGAGGVGGFINRVGKEPDWSTRHALNLQAGAWRQRRAAADWNQRLGEDHALRLNLMAEESGSYRDAYALRRHGVNPVLAWCGTPRACVVLGLEHFKDERTADRGVPSYRGRPLPTSSGAFFGNPDASTSRLAMDAFHARYEQDLGEGRSLRSALRYAYYDKFFQNVFPGAVRSGAGGLEVSLSGHNSQTRRRNLSSQSSLTLPLQHGSWRHRLQAGLELGRQDGDNWRQTGYFPAGGTTLFVPAAAPLSRVPVSFRKSATDPDTRSSGGSAAIYLQDQLRWSPQWQAVLGWRVERLALHVQDRRAGVRLESRNWLGSPRAGLVYQPLETLSIYANHGVGYLPRAGEQLLGLTLNNRALAPEKYVSQELGAKWSPRPQLDLTAALYQLRRTRVAVALPERPDAFVLADGQRTRGLELGAGGVLLPGWQVSGGYTYQDGRVLSALTPAVKPGGKLPHAPRHALGLWNRWTLDPSWAIGAGLSWRSQVFTATDNAVVLPGYTRVDAALYWQPGANLRLQLNVENLLDRRYYAFAHSNNNITPGSPRAWRLGLQVGF